MHTSVEHTVTADTHVMIPTAIQQELAIARSIIVEVLVLTVHRVPLLFHILKVATTQSHPHPFLQAVQVGLVHAEIAIMAT